VNTPITAVSARQEPPWWQVLKNCAAPPVSAVPPPRVVAEKRHQFGRVTPCAQRHSHRGSRAGRFVRGIQSAFVTAWTTALGLHSGAIHMLARLRSDAIQAERNPRAPGRLRGTIVAIEFLVFPGASSGQCTLPLACQKPSRDRQTTGFYVRQRRFLPVNRRTTPSLPWSHMADHDHKPMSWGGNSSECATYSNSASVLCAYSATTFPEWMRADDRTGPPAAVAKRSVKEGYRHHDAYAFKSAVAHVSATIGSGRGTML